MRKQNDRKAQWELDKQWQKSIDKKDSAQFTQLQQEVPSECREHQLLLEGATETHLSPTLEHPAMTQTELNFIKATTAAQSSSLTRQSVWKGPKMQPYNEEEDSKHSLRTF